MVTRLPMITSAAGQRPGQQQDGQTASMFLVWQAGLDVATCTDLTKQQADMRQLLCRKHAAS